MWTVNFLSLTTDFELSETCELLSWYLHGCILQYVHVCNDRFCILGLLDMPTIKKEYGVDYVFKAIALMCHWVTRDENCQVNGIKVFIDMSGLTMQHVTTLWTRDNSKKIMQFYQVT